MGSPPTEFAHDIDNGRRNAGVFVGVHQPFLDLGPGCPQRLWIHEGESVQRHQRLLSDVGLAVAQSRKQIGEGRKREGRCNDVREGRDGQGNDGWSWRSEVLETRISWMPRQKKLVFPPRTFFRRLVASIRTSVSGRKLWTAPRYPTRLW